MDLPRRRVFPASLLKKLLIPVMFLIGISDGIFVDYDGWKVLAFNLDTVSGDAAPLTLIQLEDMELEGYLEIISTSKAKDIAKVAVSFEAFEDLIRLQDRGLINFERISNNLGRELVLETRYKGVNIPGASPTFSSYMSFSDMTSYLESLPAKYPEKVRLEEVGRSVENRPIYLVRVTSKIGDDAEKKVIFIDGGIHAREWVSPPSVLYIIEQLLTATGLTKGIEWQLIPVLNPDGYVYSWKFNRLWRKNRAFFHMCYGVDLNRNFGYQWGGLGTSRYPCSNIYKGPSAFSEPESRALRDAMLPLDGKVEVYISFHSYGQLVMYPWAYSSEVIHPLTATMVKAGKEMVKQIENTTGAVYEVVNSTYLYYAAGVSQDWAAHELNIPYVYTIELRDNGRYGFILPADQILPTVQDAWMAVKYMGELVQENHFKSQKFHE